MAISLDFLSKTKAGAMKDVMAPKTGGFQQKQNVSSANQKTEDKQPKADLENMNSSDLMKYVYNNTANQDNKNIKLPASVKYNNQDFNINGKTFDDAVKVIAKETGDDAKSVEKELKKQYGKQSSGGSLNFQA